MSSKKKRSPLWKYFDIKSDNQKFAICSLCNVKISRGGEGKKAGTTAMKNHLKTKHPDEFSTLNMNGLVYEDKRNRLLPLNAEKLNESATMLPTPSRQKETEYKGKRNIKRKASDDVNIENVHKNDTKSSEFGEHIVMKHRKYSAYAKNMVEHLISKILDEADKGRYDDPLFKPPSSSTLLDSQVQHPQQTDKLDDVTIIGSEHGECFPKGETSKNEINYDILIKEENFTDDDDETAKSLTEEEDPPTHLEETLKAESNNSNQQSTFQENLITNNYIEQLKRPTDEYQLFVDFVGQELRNLKTEKSKKKLKNGILQLLIEIGNEDDI